MNPSNTSSISYRPATAVLIPAIRKNYTTPKARGAASITFKLSSVEFQCQNRQRNVSDDYTDRTIKPELRNTDGHWQQPEQIDYTDCGRHWKMLAIFTRRKLVSMASVSLIDFVAPDEATDEGNCSVYDENPQKNKPRP
jgi:hypothetical protein